MHKFIMLSLLGACIGQMFSGCAMPGDRIDQRKAERRHTASPSGKDVTPVTPAEAEKQLRPGLSLVVCTNKGILQYSNGSWSDRTALFGFTPDSFDHFQVSRAGEWQFAAGDSSSVHHRIIDLKTETIRPITFVRNERYVNLLRVMDNGIVWWLGFARNSTVLWRNNGGVNARFNARHCASSFDMRPNGSVCWKVNPGTGRVGSNDFAELIPGFTTVLYWAASGGGQEKVLSKSGTIHKPRFVDDERIVYWCEGPVDSAKDAKQWILRLVEIRTGKVTELTRRTVGCWQTSGCSAPDVVVGRGVIGWPTDWTRGTETRLREWTFLVGDKTRTFRNTYGEVVLPCDGRYTSGRLVLRNDRKNRIVVYDPVDDSIAEIPYIEEYMVLYWAEFFEHASPQKPPLY